MNRPPIFRIFPRRATLRHSSAPPVLPPTEPRRPSATLHVSVHYNGWGDFPNPDGYTNSKKLHAYFEGEFVRANLKREAVALQVEPYKPCDCTIQQKVMRLLTISLENVRPLYDIEAQGGFKPASRWSVDFATMRLATGAQFIRDMIMDAWRASATGMIGYPMVNVRDIGPARSGRCAS